MPPVSDDAEAADCEQPRVVLVTNIAPPYRLATWEELARRVGSLDVLLCAESEPNRTWHTPEQVPRGYSIRVLPGRHIGLPRSEMWIHWNPSVVRMLFSLRPTHIIVTGFDTPTYWLSMVAARFLGCRVTMWWESHKRSGSRHGFIATSIRKLALRLCDSVITAGTAASRYVSDLGVPDSRLVTGVNALDSSHWFELVEPHIGETSSRVGDRVVRILYVGQFIERKGVLDLLKVYERMKHCDVCLTLVGYGPQEEEMRAFALKHELPRLEFAGATTSPEETARHFANADILVVPSHREVWGFVVNEGLASGLYVVASDAVGAVEDLIDAAPVPVGSTFEARNIDDFHSKLVSAVERIPMVDRRQIVQWAREQSPAKYADAIYRALMAADPERPVE